MAPERKAVITKKKTNKTISTLKKKILLVGILYNDIPHFNKTTLTCSSYLSCSFKLRRDLRNFSK